MTENGAGNPILITGGCGFIGSNFIRHLRKFRPGWRLVNLDKLTYAGSRERLADLEGLPGYEFVHGDIADEALVDDLFRENAFQGVVHLAAESHVDNSIASPESFIRTNIDGTFVLLDACRRHWNAVLGHPAAQRFLHVSTDEVFGSLGAVGYFNEKSPYAPNSPYSASKAASDHLVRSYVKTYGLNAVVTNCSNNFGPYQHREKLIPTIIRKALFGEPIPIYGQGTNVRDWIYVGDHCEALLSVYERADPGAHYVIGGGNEWNNLDLARHICDILDGLRPLAAGKSYADQIRFVNDRPGHDHRYAVDASALSNDLGWEPATGFADAIRATVLGYLEETNA